MTNSSDDFCIIGSINLLKTKNDFNKMLMEAFKEKEVRIEKERETK